MTTPEAPPAALSAAFAACAASAREHARDQWLGALFAPAAARDGLNALAAFDLELAQATRRARDPNLAAIRLAWWREAALGKREAEAAGNPAALAMRATMRTFALPEALVEAMVDARLTEIAPPEPFPLAAFEDYAATGEGARLRLAVRIACLGQDRDEAQAHEPAGMALALVRLLTSLPDLAGARPTLFPDDLLERHGAAPADIDARRATPGVVEACVILLALARERLFEAERRLQGAPAAVAAAFVPLGALALDIDRLVRNAARPFDPPAPVSALRRQWAIWRWTRRR